MMKIKKSALMVTLDNYCCTWVTLTCKRVFYAHLNTALWFVFLWVKIQHQMEVLNPIYMTPNMTALTKMKKRSCFMKGDCVDRMLPFAKQYISKWGSKYDSKNN